MDEQGKDQVQDPAVTQPEQPEVAQELKFTGFAQPKEQGMWAVLRRHKVKSILGVFAVIVLVGVGVLIAVSSGSSTPSVEEQAQNIAPTTIDDPSDTTAEPAPEASTAPDISSLQYSLNSDGERLELATDDSVWLQRTDASWNEVVQWGDWLFFAANRSADPSTRAGSPDYRVGIETFNLAAKSYLSIQEITPPLGADLVGPMYVENDYLYMRFADDQTAGSTYRCTLDEQKSCSDFELFYSGRGTTTQLKNGSILVRDSRTVGVVENEELRLYDPATQTDSLITTLTNDSGIGSQLAVVAEDNLLWIVETSGDAAKARSDPAYDGFKLERLYAINLQGETQFVLPSNGFPIAGAQYSASEDATLSVLFVNDTQEVAFDTTTKQFGPARTRSTAPAESADSDTSVIRKIVDITSRLELPADYTLRSVQD